jgi:site-specific recombinase XerD
MKLTGHTAQLLFTRWLANRAYSEETLKRYTRETGFFCAWLATERGKTDIRDVTKKDIVSYCIFLSQAEKDDGGRRRFGAGTQNGMRKSLNVFFRFLSRNEYILSNPFDTLDLDMILVEQLRESVPEQEMHRLLDGIPLDHPLHIRDRALFELMYGTGLRVSEVSRLNLTDVDLNSGRLLVRQGKGRKDRYVPLGRNVSKYLELYLKKGRDDFLAYVKENSMREALFLSYKGRRLGIAGIEERLKKWHSELHPEARNICPHMLRHSFATHVLDHGAGVKEVKEILGHKCIETTVRYTHFSIKSLKRILKMYHPRENELYVELTDKECEEIVAILNGR